MLSTDDLDCQTWGSNLNMEGFLMSDNMTYNANELIPTTNDSNRTSGGMDYMDYKISGVDRVLDGLNLYGIPIVIVVGLLGNTLSFVIFVSSSQLRLQSSSVYLAFLNAVDNVFLLTVFIVVWLNYIYVPLLHRNGWCQLTVYLSYVSAFLSVYTVVCFTVERAIVVFKPFHRTKWCTPRRARYTVLTFFVVSLLMYSFVLWSHKVVHFVVGDAPTTVCHWDEKYISALKILNVIDTLLTCLLPSVAIGVINFAIAVKIYRVALDRRRNLMACNVNSDRRTFMKAYAFGKKSSSEASNDSYTMQVVVTSKRVSSVTSHSSVSQRSIRSGASSMLQLRTTRTLLLVSSVFVLLNLPSHSLKIYVFVAQYLDPGFITPVSLLRWQVVVQFLSYINFSANFFLYCAFSMTFRCALKRSFMRTKYRLSKICRYFQPRYDIDFDQHI